MRRLKKLTKCWTIWILVRTLLPSSSVRVFPKTTKLVSNINVSVYAYYLGVQLLDDWGFWLPCYIAYTLNTMYRTIRRRHQQCFRFLSTPFLFHYSLWKHACTVGSFFINHSPMCYFVAYLSADSAIVRCSFRNSCQLHYQTWFTQELPTQWCCAKQAGCMETVKLCVVYLNYGDLQQHLNNCGHCS